MRPSEPSRSMSTRSSRVGATPHLDASAGERRRRRLHSGPVDRQETSELLSATSWCSPVWLKASSEHLWTAACSAKRPPDAHDRSLHLIASVRCSLTRSALPRGPTGPNRSRSAVRKLCRSQGRWFASSVCHAHDVKTRCLGPRSVGEPLPRSLGLVEIRVLEPGVLQFLFQAGTVNGDI